MILSSFSPPRLLLVAALLPMVLAGSALAQATPLPANLGGGLDKLVEWYQANGQTKADRTGRMKKDAPVAARAKVDAAVQQAVVDVRLDGTKPLAAVQTALEALGVQVLASHELAGPGSTISAKLPLTQAVAAAQTPGVFSVVLAHRPISRVGKTTSQGAALLKTDVLNFQGLNGNGITIGVISDSFDTAYPPAADDVASRDLPGPGNPTNSQPVQVLAEGDPYYGTDEGRAMLQIIHDLAPKAKLVFASSGDTTTVFAQRVTALRTQALCDIVVDDIGFPDEPFFSDGVGAQAVDDAVHSTTLAGRPIHYFSAAGNDGDSGFVDTFRPVADADVRSKAVPNNLKLSKVPGFLTDGGFHNFAQSGTPAIVQKVKSKGAYTDIDFQWDDPFVPGSITTDYNVLVFDALGNFLPRLSGIDHNISVGQAIEFASIPPGGTYQIAITRRNEGSPVATHLRYVANTSGTFTSNYLPRRAPTTFGHGVAPGSDAVAAQYYSTPGMPEDFTSLGPVTIYFDRAGNRLAAPQVRQQPTMAAPDGVNTSFFPDPLSDSDGDGFPNFFGTSAAAPHAAAVGALLLQAAGGPGKLTETQMRNAMQQSAGSHDRDAYFSQASASAGNGAVATLTATGSDGNSSSNDPKFFHLSLTGAGAVLQSITIDLAPAGLKFDPTAKVGYPFTVGTLTGGLKRSQVVPKFSVGTRSSLTLSFKGGTFGPGAMLEFGVDRDDASTSSGGNSADELAGATISFTTAGGAGTGTFQNSIGVGYSPTDGFGLINAQTAVSLLP